MTDGCGLMSTDRYARDEPSGFVLPRDQNDYCSGRDMLEGYTGLHRSVRSFCHDDADIFEFHGRMSIERQLSWAIYRILTYYPLGCITEGGFGKWGHSNHVPRREKRYIFCDYWWIWMSERHPGGYSQASR